MRELKFRAWDIDKQEYITWFEIGCEGCVTTQEPNCSPDYPNVILEQYTGLKDKNGKEIYEGDIVKYLSYRKNYIGQVVFDFVDDSEGYYIEKHYGWGIYRDDYNTSLGDYADGNMECEGVEIIGNVHENPELVKEEE